MTIQELYAKIGGNYDQAVKIMKMDKLIDRYIRKFQNTDAFDALLAAKAAMDPTQLFESAHALKGVCANLGLDDLAAAASRVTEEFRPGATRKMTDDEVKAAVDKIDEMYKRTVAGIQEYVGNA